MRRLILDPCDRLVTSDSPADPLLSIVSSWLN